MVSSTNYAMVSTLAGLKRLEAQIQRAMLEASGQAPQMPVQAPEKVADKMEHEAAKTAARANSVINALDISA
jgi:hypothetical protein